MKSLKILAVRIIKLGLIAIVIIYFGLFSYFKFGWRNHYPKAEVENIIRTLHNTPALSDSFYIVYDKFYSDRHERITNRYWTNFWADFIPMNTPIQNNWQFEVANIQRYKGFRYKLAPMTLAFRIDKEVPPEKCFDFIMTKRYYDYCRLFKINDTISNLKETKRIIDFIVANERPGFYRSHPTRYMHETDSLKSIIEIP